MEYRPLSAVNEEVRLISIVPTLPNAEGIIEQSCTRSFTSTNSVSCHLDHYSLKDLQSSQASKERPPAKSSTQLNWGADHDGSGGGDSPSWSYSWGDYVALSYTWGDVTDTRDIFLNGHQITVGANLESVLRILRQKQPIKAGYKIWVDALCINQRDTVERGQQVKRMGKIYRQAHDVIIWLGNEGRKSGLAMDLILTLSKACATGQDRALGNSLRQQSDLLGRGCWRALSELLDRPYWDRLWVLQEIALGGGRTSILCGLQAVTWKDFYSAIYSFGTHNTDILFSLIDQERRYAGLGASGLKRNKLIHLNEEQSVQAGQAIPQFMCMLDLGRKSLATDPRDKVYGLLGMMDSSVSDLIVPDYNAPLDRVFTDFAKAFMVASDSLELLEQCTWSTNCMPSWVPDWTNTDHFRLFSGRSTYHATKGLKANFHFDMIDQSLSCQGVRIDSIDGLGESYHENCTPRTFKDAVIQPQGNYNAYGSAGALQKALWNTLVGGRDLRGKIPPEAYEGLLVCSPTDKGCEPSTPVSRGRTSFNRLILQSANLRIAGKTLGSYFPSVSGANAKDVREPLERVFRFMRSRRLALTVTGFIGAVPIDARKGDVVCLLLGCNVPMVLRAAENRRYRVVGCCYLHGVMEGEVMEWLRMGSSYTEEIILY